MFSERLPSHCATCPIKEDKLCKHIVRTGQGASGLAPKVTRTVGARRPILQAGNQADDLVILCYGIAMKYSRTQDGRRVAYSIRASGDPLNPSTLVGDVALHSVEAVTETRVAVFDRSRVKALFALDQDLLFSVSKQLNDEVAELTSLARVLALGTADQRVAHLIEVWVAPSPGRRDAFPDSRLQHLRQQDIADATGLSAAHVNRILKKLRNSRVVDLVNGRIRLIDREAFSALRLS